MSPIKALAILDPNGPFEMGCPFMDVPGALMMTKADMPNITGMTAARA